MFMRVQLQGFRAKARFEFHGSHVNCFDMASPQVKRQDPRVKSLVFFTHAESTAGRVGVLSPY